MKIVVNIGSKFMTKKVLLHSQFYLSANYCLQLHPKNIAKTVFLCLNLFSSISIGKNNSKFKKQKIYYKNRE